jgi:hypothetical protein
MTAGEPYDDGEQDEEDNRANHGADDAEDQPDAHLELGGLGPLRSALRWVGRSTGRPRAGHRASVLVRHDTVIPPVTNININAI